MDKQEILKLNKARERKAVREYKARLVKAIRDSDIFEITCNHCYITDNYYDEQDDLIKLIKKTK